MTSALAVELEHPGVVHLVDVIAAQDEHLVDVLAFYPVDVLEYRIPGALVPVPSFFPGQVRLEQADIAVRRHQAPRRPDADVLGQGHGLVLREHDQVVDAGVDAVAQGEIDDAVLAGERNCRFSAFLRQDAQALPHAAG